MKKIENLGKQLSAEEQKLILGSTGCKSDGCWISSAGNILIGNCGWQNVPGQPGYGVCECVTSAGYYPPPEGGSMCWMP